MGGVLQLELGAQRARFYVHSNWVAADLMSFGGEQILLQRLVSMLRPGDVVYDVGANMGLYAVFLGQAVGAQGQVMAFEPEPHYCERLRGNAALNGLHNVRIFCLALGDCCQESELLPSEKGTAAPRLAEVPPAGGWSRPQLKVQVVEGDRLVEIENLSLPRAVKIDVEGYEYAVLRGLRRTLSNPLCEIVCCEIHPGLLPEGLGPDEIRELLKSCGFTRFDVLPRPPQVHVLAVKEGSAREGRV
jgi:FkbM family methyltransferase